MNVVLDKAMYEKGRALKTDEKSVRRAIEETVNTGQVGALNVDPAYLVFEPQSRKFNPAFLTRLFTKNVFPIFSSVELILIIFQSLLRFRLLNLILSGFQ